MAKKVLIRQLEDGRVQIGLRRTNAPVLWFQGTYASVAGAKRAAETRIASRSNLSFEEVTAA